MEIISSSESEQEPEILTKRRVSPRKSLNSTLPDVNGIDLESKNNETNQKSPRKKSQKKEEQIPKPEIEADSLNSKKRKASRLESIVEDEKSTLSPRRRSSRIKRIEDEKPPEPDSPPNPVSPPRKREKLDPKISLKISKTPKSRRASAPSSSKIVSKSSKKSKRPDPNRIRSGSTFSSDSFTSSSEEDEPPKDGLKKLMKRSNNTPRKTPQKTSKNHQKASKKPSKASKSQPDVIEIDESDAESPVEIISDSEIDEHRSRNPRPANLDRDLDLKIAARMKKAECELIIDDENIDSILAEIQALNKNMDVQEHWKRVSNQGVSDESDILQVILFFLNLPKNVILKK